MGHYSDYYEQVERGFRKPLPHPRSQTTPVEDEVKRLLLVCELLDKRISYLERVTVKAVEVKPD